MRKMQGTVATVGRLVIVATSNEELRRLVERGLREQDVDVEFVSGGASALSKLEKETCWALLLDRALPDLNVEEVKGIVESRFPDVHQWVVRMESGQVAFEGCAESGPEPREFHLFCGGFNTCDLTPKCGSHKPSGSFPEAAESAGGEPLPGIVGRSEAMKRVQAMVRMVAPRKTAVLLTGETGTGKDLVAQALHQLGPRAARPLVIVNCAAIPETLFESELFGYHRGAFTGAVESRLGRIQSAHMGTLFLDEVGELPLSMQAKLLRFLQEGEVQRLGGHELLRVDVRVIAATNSELEERVSKGQFREDLFYRLSVFPIELEPLRERSDDIVPLAEHFLREFGAEESARPKALAAGAIRLLLEHSWPGNVRELKHSIERAVILAGQSAWLEPEHFSLRARNRLPQNLLMLHR